MGGVEFARTEKKSWEIPAMANLYSMFNCVKHTLPLMMDRGYGRIINLGSTTGMGDSADGGDKLAVYAACKAGVIAFTKAIAREVGSFGINVNSISPGIVRTRVFERLSREYIDGLVSKTPLGESPNRKTLRMLLFSLFQINLRSSRAENICPTGGLVMH